MLPRPECSIVRISDYRRPKAARLRSNYRREQIKHYIARMPDGQLVVRTFPEDAAHLKQLLDACNELSAELLKLLPDDC